MTKFTKVLLIAGGVVLAGACTDDPLGVTEQPTGDEAAVESLISTARSRAGGLNGMTIDRYRPRLVVDFTVDGTLAENTPITLRLEGVAQGKIVGGEAVVVMPTFAAMKYAGSDKQPYYPAGKKLPEAARWTLPAMEAGDHWKQVIDIAGVEKGYYHVAIDVTANGPEDDASDSYLSTDAFEQAWMFVFGEAGILTRAFDASLFPDDIAPQPGPFRVRGESHATQTAASRDVGSDSDDSDPVYLYVSYLDDGENQPAEGAYAYANTLLDEGEDEDSPPTNEGHTVPEDGFVAFSCPAAGEYWAGHVTLPSNDLVSGAAFGAYWQASSADCGDTIQVPGFRHTYMPWDNLDHSIRLLNEHFDFEREIVRWRTDLDLDPDDDASRYLVDADSIVFGPNSYYKLWTAAHEYIHAIHATELGGLWDTEDCNPHFVWLQSSSYTCAFLEGFADYGGWYVDPDDDRTDELQEGDDSFLDPGDERGEFEGWVAALFLDLIDEYDSSEPSDSTSYPADFLADVFATCEVDGDERNDVSDFVWCLEGEVDDDLHEDHFGGVTPTPDDVEHDAVEPDDLEARHIRATWLLNVSVHGGG